MARDPSFKVKKKKLFLLFAKVSLSLQMDQNFFPQKGHSVSLFKLGLALRI